METGEAGRCTVVVGSQWGDEGKGKIVDVLSEEVDVVARYQGGANAGHTVHVGDDEFVLHQIPSGILHGGTRCLLGNGVVLDVVQFFEEYDSLAKRGIQVEGRVGVSERAHLLLPYHRWLDQAREAALTSARIGTTGRGIGPAYVDKAGRHGIRVVDTLDQARLREMAAAGLARAFAAFPDMDRGSLEVDMAAALEVTPRLAALVTETGDEVWNSLRAGQHVLLEGAQGTVLDLDHGTYPFVTSSTTTAGGAATGIGIGPTAIDSVLGVVKAYTTRVGNGPLPTGFEPEMDEHVRKLGGEFGATTGRPRRCGWFDAVVGRLAARVNGLTALAVTKLDVLDTLPELRIATAYRTSQGVVESFPANTGILGDVEPVYEVLPGWESRTEDARKIADLPHAARTYLDRIEELLEVPVQMVSVGTQRSQIIRT